MPTILTRTLRQAVREPGEPLNILTIGATHERYESNLARVGHRFWCLQAEGLKPWDATYAPVPPNYTILDAAAGAEQVPADVAIDVVLSQTRYEQYHVGRQFSRSMFVPHVTLEHLLPKPHWPATQLATRAAQRGTVDVFISEYSRAAWGVPGTVIEHGVDTETFAPRPGWERDAVALSVVNDWQKRDLECGYQFWREATDETPVRVLGRNPGLSEPARDLDELVHAYRTSLVFVNTSLISPVPTSLLEAMACGCAVVTTRNPMIDSIVEDGVNGFTAGDPGAMRSCVRNLLGRPDLAAQLGAAARRTILDRFGLDRFVRDWTIVFERAAHATLTGEWP